MYIDDSGTVLTNGHVIEGGDSIQVEDHAGRVHEYRKGRSLAQTDTTLLVAIDPNPNTVPVDFAQTVRRGQAVMAMGYPVNLLVSHNVLLVTQGTVGAVEVVYDDTDFLLLDAAGGPGSSGSPVFNVDGLVVGMVEGEGGLDGRVSAAIDVTGLVP